MRHRIGNIVVDLRAGPCERCCVGAVLRGRTGRVRHGGPDGGADQQRSRQPRLLLGLDQRRQRRRRMACVRRLSDPSVARGGRRLRRRRQDHVVERRSSPPARSTCRCARLHGRSASRRATSSCPSGMAMDGSAPRGPRPSRRCRRRASPNPRVSPSRGARSRPMPRASSTRSRHAVGRLEYEGMSDVSSDELGGKFDTNMVSIGIRYNF